MTANVGRELRDSAQKTEQESSYLYASIVNLGRLDDIVRQHPKGAREFIDALKYRVDHAAYQLQEVSQKLARLAAQHPVTPMTFSMGRFRPPPRM